MDGEISHADGWADAPPILFLEAPKRECAAPGGREKTLRRVGLRQRRPPAAGGGRLAVPCGSQGRKRAVLGESFGPGKLGIHPASLFAAAGEWSMKVAAWVNATVSTTARAARSEAERAEREAGQMRPCNPTTWAPSATGRQYRPGRRPKRARRQGQIGACTDTPTPVSTEARTRRRAPKSGLFFWTVHGPLSFRPRPKRKWGVHPAGPAPCGSRISPGRRHGGSSIPYGGYIARLST